MMIPLIGKDKRPFRWDLCPSNTESDVHQQVKLDKINGITEVILYNPS